MLDQRPDAHVALHTAVAKVLAVKAAQRVAVSFADTAQDRHEDLGGKPRRDFLIVAARRHHRQAWKANIVENAGAVAAVEQHHGVLGAARAQQRHQLHGVSWSLLKTQRGRGLATRGVAMAREQKHQQPWVE